ncbi:hypothetical protein V6N11_071125 [Hibiscus sabdariffa]|uniref:RNase H type-1 domain-containing protein n=1 Tax=Hibiscus sabdariffa TaxID=183260 RepID=A0ABR2TZ81_9ROSI
MVETLDLDIFSRNSRKHRRLDDDPLDDGEIWPASAIPPPSYKDSLMKDNVAAIHTADEIFDDEEIEIQEGDVICSLVDGIISIDFSNRIQSLPEKSLDQTLVVKLLGRRIGYTTLRTKIYEIWKPKQAIRLMDIENDYFLVTFKLCSDYLKVLANGPWTIFGHYLTVQQWTPEFTTSIPYPTKEFCPDLLPKPDCVAAAEVHDTVKPSDTSPSADSYDNGNWGTRQLSTLFNNAVIPYILSIRCPDPSDLPDRPIWGMNGKLSFDIKSAYSSLSASSWNDESQRWKTIWSSQVPQRLRVFLWLSLKGSHGHFFCGDLAEWLHFNVGSNELHSSRGLPWSTLFISTIWQLWKASNDLVFNDVPFNAATLLQRSVLWARYYLEKTTTAAPAQPPSSNAVHWKLPELGWVCLSTDGAVSLGSDIGSVGGVFRVDDGSWISGFNKTIGVACPLQTELWRILLGLQLAMDNGFEWLIVQSDSKEAIKRLASMQVSSDPCSLVRTIDRMCHRGWATEFRWIPRDGNKPANMLSKFDNLPNYGVTIFSQPPEALLPLLDFDMLHSL